jgi:hypothetical protein
MKKEADAKIEKLDAQITKAGAEMKQQVSPFFCCPGSLRFHPYCRS